MSAHLNNLEACVLIISECHLEGCPWSKPQSIYYLYGWGFLGWEGQQSRCGFGVTAIDVITHFKISDVVSFDIQMLAALSAANWGSEATLICRAGLRNHLLCDPPEVIRRPCPCIGWMDWPLILSYPYCSGVDLRSPRSPLGDLQKGRLLGKSWLHVSLLWTVKEAD